MITIHELALHRGMKSTTGDDSSYSGRDYADVGLGVIGGCAYCRATLAAYNAYPTKTGYWMCYDCVESFDAGYDTAEEADKKIFGTDSNRIQTRETTR